MNCRLVTDKRFIRSDINFLNSKFWYFDLMEEFSTCNRTPHHQTFLMVSNSLSSTSRISLGRKATAESCQAVTCHTA